MGRLGARLPVDYPETKKMSRVEVCALAYEGKFIELKEKIGLKPSLATKLDEVRFRTRLKRVCFGWLFGCLTWF